MQVPAPFDYAKATSVDHALALLAEHGPEARVVAGGHSLIPMMKLRLARPDALIDINGLTDLAYLRTDGDSLAVGALTRHVDVLTSPLVAEHFAVLVEAERVIADPIVRNWGTVGGSLCQADPAEDLPAALVALGATVVIRNREGSRTVPVRELHVGPYETVVEAGELLTEVRIPIRPGGSSAYEKVERRAGDWGAAAAAAALWLTSGVAGYSIDDVGLGLTAVGAEHYIVPEAEEFLRGKLATEENFAAAGEIAARTCNPAADQRGPVDYKRHLAKELTVRALRRAAGRARVEEA
ncbi:xanthine dehydrogenase family protein subunit M [Luedemannella flava]|uniref:Xanthine dehydrogenase family protein subunit M n=1 Tax=Luedemannella flava TaxID=349316 RepID=A0ABN2LLI3_9ACTN